MDPWIGLYRRYPVSFVRGEGMWLYDTEGKAYLDFLAGIGASSLGHHHPLMVEHLTEALPLLHTSNLFQHPGGQALAERLSEISEGMQVFFCNSGTEANEAAIKFCRRWGQERGRNVLLSATHAFHGRTLGSLALTPHPPYQDPFRPLPAGMATFTYGDIADLTQALGKWHPCGVFLEPIQGEAGVVVPPPGFLAEAARLVREHGALLVIDDIQAGMGRTGYYFAEAAEGVMGDVVTLAKGLGGGVPMGAVLVRREVAESLQPGDHGTTFGGGPLAAAAGLAVTQWLAEGGLDHVRAVSVQMQAQLEGVAALHPGLVETVRGRGLMWGMVLQEPAPPVVAEALQLGLVTNAAHERVIRFLPPLIAQAADFERMADRLHTALTHIYG